VRTNIFRRSNKKIQHDIPEYPLPYNNAENDYPLTAVLTLLYDYNGWIQDNMIALGTSVLSKDTIEFVSGGPIYYEKKSEELQHKMKECVISENRLTTIPKGRNAHTTFQEWMTFNKYQIAEYKVQILKSTSLG